MTYRFFPKSNSSRSLLGNSPRLLDAYAALAYTVSGGRHGSEARRWAGAAEATGRADAVAPRTRRLEPGAGSGQAGRAEVHIPELGERTAGARRAGAG